MSLTAPKGEFTDTWQCTALPGRLTSSNRISMKMTDTHNCTDTACIASRVRHRRQLVPALAATLVLLLWFISSNGFAAEFESPQSIRTTVDGFVTQRLQHSKRQDFDVRVDRLDSRLRLARCGSALEPFLPTATRLMGKVTVGVRCPAGKTWTVYVPVQIDVYENVLTAARPLLHGQRITASDVMVGMVAKRSIPAGKAFSLQLVEAPRLVQRGEDVTLVAETDFLTVRMKGKALADGAKGDVIKVKNSTSNRVVEGIVTRPGVVKVKM